MTAWALFCHDFDLSKGINILSEKCPVVLDHYTPNKCHSDKKEYATSIPLLTSYINVLILIALCQFCVK